MAPTTPSPALCRAPETRLAHSLHLQVSSLTLFEKMPVSKLFSDSDYNHDSRAHDADNRVCPRRCRYGDEKSFYARFGFRPFSERESLMLLLRTSELAALLEP